ncbi:hypothetical protein [Actinorhabdospora filicis]|uniref:hypothetical protein n=1 Tax=Actinorhabdospora filicis TaxID=1785913 RepID=UPI00255770BC|nr:hypothetical protein [Actinorhabdospora filicis]
MEYLDSTVARTTHPSGLRRRATAHLTTHLDASAPSELTATHGVRLRLDQRTDLAPGIVVVPWAALIHGAIRFTAIDVALVIDVYDEPPR